jgi:hypothetical protein
MKKDYLLYAVAALIGVAIWVAIAAISGKREAWDSDIYFSVGMTVACVASFVLGSIEPERPWRWGALPFAGQFVAMLAMAGVGSLLPLGVIMFGVLSIPAILTARLGAFVATKRRASS